VRIALLTEIPAPYRIPLFNALAADDDVDLLVLFLSANDPRRDYPAYESEFSFDRRTLRGFELTRGGRWIIANVGTIRYLRRFRPDVVIVGGWNQPACWLAALYTRLRRIPLVVWVESTGRDERSGSPLLERLKRAIVGAAAGFLVPGTAAGEYVRALGGERVAVAPNAVELGIFRDRVDRLRADRAEIREADGLDGCVFLCVSRLSREKGVDVLVRAMTDVPATLVVIGDGPDAELVKSLAGPNVRLLGRRERDDLPHWYAAADAFVLPSRSETWGIVLNEAAAAGLPLIASEASGASWDLIVEEENGYRVPAEDEDALIAVLSRVAADPAWRTQAAARSRERAEPYTAEAWAGAVAELARDLTGYRR
jgi:glycosyltransferase involved in cell wall biosynthesis